MSDNRFAVRSCVFLLLAGSVSVRAQHPKTVLDGVYTTAQAARGKNVYEAKCATCHKADLSGFSGPPLKTDQFLDRWREFDLNVLTDVIRNDMPLGNPGTLKEAEYIDIASYILQANGIPPGARELTSAALPVTLFVGPGGPKPLPSSAQVSVVGCLIEDSGNGFFAAAATEPARTLDSFQLSPEEVQAAQKTPYGSLVFRLENLSDLPGFTHESVRGFKGIAKGILVRQPNGSRINVTALKAFTESCDPNDVPKK